ncbi:hypothetical protein H9649_15460 [Sporosarcina sp. Sa2YVA2]|uniref:Uncharacterized protein n=1 Tax=Sporosarcina quadrami TaxID=2762234 RepID=A0ABR8UD57_9BACL|nr:hypothetical protein [Sporosarcina quadrami]
MHKAQLEATMQGIIDSQVVQVEGSILATVKGARVIEYTFEVLVKVYIQKALQPDWGAFAVPGTQTFTLTKTNMNVTTFTIE